MHYFTALTLLMALFMTLTMVIRFVGAVTAKRKEDFLFEVSIVSILWALFYYLTTI